MIENHQCTNCRQRVHVWLPLVINRPPVSDCDHCGHTINFQFVYDRRERMSLEEQELAQLSYLERKYKGGTTQ